MDKLDDSDEEGAGSYAKFKTKNELDQVEIEKQGPKFEVKQLDDVDTVLPFGTVVQFINDGPNGMLLVMPSNQLEIYDLDNIVCLPEMREDADLSKVVVGFVSDLVGPV